MYLWDEIRRRNVHRVAIAYVAVAWLLIQVAETLFPVFGLSDTAIRAVVIVLAIGIVPALILSWVFEWTPQGLRRDSEVTTPAPAARTRRFDAAIIAVLVVAMAYFAVDKFVFDPSRDAAERETARLEGRADALVESFGDRSIVVLPFVNISSDPEQEYLGDGLAEELLNLLARIDGLRVISRTSAFSFKGKETTSTEIARVLNVSYVLEGSVRKSGDLLRITAQLIDARADAHVWSDTYDHSGENIFDIQDSVAGKVVGHLMTELALDLPVAERHDPVAYALYLQAEQLESEEMKRDLLLRALELEPGFLDAKFVLAGTHHDSGSVALDSGDTELAEYHFEQARTLFDEILSANPTHPSVNATKAWDMFGIPDVAQAAMFAERALESEPTHFNALTTAGEVLTRLWRPEQAIPILRYVSVRDPLASHHFDNLADAYLDSGQYALAEEALRVWQVLEPEDTHWVGWELGIAMLLQGKAAEALQVFNDDVSSDFPLGWHGKALALHELGRDDEALVELNRLLELDADTPRLQWIIGTAYAWMGKSDEAFRYFELQRERNIQIFSSAGNTPLYAKLHDDPRWPPFLASVGLDPDDLASIEFNPSLPAEIRRDAKSTLRTVE